MGCYINPPDKSKEDFLDECGDEITREQFAEWDFSDSSLLPVVLVANPLFTAAGVAYDARERDVFLYEPDPRPKKYFLVKVENLLPVTKDLEKYREKGEKWAS